MDACLPTDYRPPSPTLATAVLYGEREVCVYASREQHVSTVQSRTPDPRAGVVTRILGAVQKCLRDMMSDRTSV